MRAFAFFLFPLAALVACSSTVTSVGAIDDDAGTSPPGNQDSGTTLSDASATSDAIATDAPIESGPATCAAGECGAKVCGRDECGHVCGVCANSPANGGCFMGHCNQSCPGTPCVDHDGHHICEGERGARGCAGGTLHLEVCTCSGGGANAWINCGACL